MLSLMLDPRFKSFWLVSSIIGQEHGVSNCEKTRQMSLFPMFLKCHQILHPMVEFEAMVGMEIDKD